MGGSDEDRQLHQRRAVIEKILRHLGLWRADKPNRPPPEIILQDEMETQSFDDGWPGYYEPGITLN
ncbi:MAG: hypothetical protein JXK94_03885 [Deltaproteobacteria bacterium]|nr:hypothetical protein [Deltaproteobacteria bacterium]